MAPGGLTYFWHKPNRNRAGPEHEALANTREITKMSILNAQSASTAPEGLVSLNSFTDGVMICDLDRPSALTVTWTYCG